jgi:hypothetical protein
MMKAREREREEREREKRKLSEREGGRKMGDEKKRRHNKISLASSN